MMQEAQAPKGKTDKLEFAFNKFCISKGTTM
jgi:hypothetical protein